MKPWNALPEENKTYGLHLSDNDAHWCVCHVLLILCWVKSRYAALRTAAWRSFCSSCLWIRAEMMRCETNYLDVNNAHHHINELFCGNNKYNKYRYNAAKRVTPRLRRHGLSSVTAAPLLSLQPYCAALWQDNRNTQGDVSRSAFFARQLDFCTGEKRGWCSLLCAC